MEQEKEIVLSDEERQQCEIWSRCMGYHRPVSEWNIGKKQEFKDRVDFKINEEMTHGNPDNQQRLN